MTLTPDLSPNRHASKASIRTRVHWITTTVKQNYAFPHAFYLSDLELSKNGAHHPLIIAIEGSKSCAFFEKKQKNLTT